jgi:hypothetical protein
MTGSVACFNKLLSNRTVDRHQLRAVGKSSFHLNLVHHFGHAFHDIFPLENRRAKFHEFRYGAAIADSFEQLGCNERDSLGVIQPQSARAALAGKFRGAGDQQLVNFPWCEVHILFFKRRETNFYRDAFLRMISKRLAIDHAKSKCSAYVGAALLCRESLEEENVEKPHPSQKT